MVNIAFNEPMASDVYESLISFAIANATELK